MVLHTRGSIWRKASTALIILPYLWLCRKTHMKIRSNLSAGESISMHGDGMMQSGPETFEVWSPRLFELFEVWKRSRPLSIWYRILYIYRCSDFVWYSIVLFCLLMHVDSDVDINIQLHCRVPSTMACTRHVPEIPLKKPLEILKFSHEIANSQGSCLGQ